MHEKLPFRYFWGRRSLEPKERLPQAPSEKSIKWLLLILLFLYGFLGKRSGENKKADCSLIVHPLDKVYKPS